MDCSEIAEEIELAFGIQATFGQDYTMLHVVRVPQNKGTFSELYPKFGT